jgi:hypothetical protein
MIKDSVKNILISVNLLDTFFVLSCRIQRQAIPARPNQRSMEHEHAYVRFSFPAEFVLPVFPL